MLGSLANPQSLNRYAYVGNNPINFSDPTGHDFLSTGPGSSYFGADVHNPDDRPIGQLPPGVEEEYERLKALAEAEASAGASDPAPAHESEAPEHSAGESAEPPEHTETNPTDAGEHADPQNSSSALHEQLHSDSQAALADHSGESQGRFAHVRVPIPSIYLPLINLVKKARKPDFYIFTGAYSGVQGSVAVTRACTFTVSLGGTAGNVATLMAGWILQLDRPLDRDVIDFLTGPSFGAEIFWNPWTKFGAGAGGGLIRSPQAPGTRWAVTVGLGLGGGFSEGNGWTWSDLTKRFFP